MTITNGGSLGSRTKLLMKKRNVSKEQLRKEANIAIPTLNDLLADRRKPQFKTLKRLANYLGKSILWLREGVEHVDNPKRKNFYVNYVINTRMENELTVSDYIKLIGHKYFGVKNQKLSTISEISKELEVPEKEVEDSIKLFIEDCEKVYGKTEETKVLNLDEEVEVTVEDLMKRFSIKLDDNENVNKTTDEVELDADNLHSDTKLKLALKDKRVRANNFTMKDSFNKEKYYLAKNLRNFMIVNDLSQLELANLAEVSINSITRSVSHVDSTKPSKLTLTKLASSLGVSKKDLRSKEIEFEKSSEINYSKIKDVETKSVTELNGPELGYSESEIMSLNLKAFLKNKGMSSIDLVADSSISSSTINRILNTRSGNRPRLETLERLTEFMGVSLKDFRSTLITFGDNREVEVTKSKEDEVVKSNTTKAMKTVEKTKNKSKSEKEDNKINPQLEEVLSLITELTKEIDKDIKEVKLSKKVQKALCKSAKKLDKQKLDLLKSIDKKVGKLSKKSSLKAIKTKTELLSIKIDILNSY